MNIITFLIALAILIVVLKILTFPFKIIIKFVINSIIGAIVLAVLGFFGIGIIITWWSAALIGFLGVPGVVIALIISMIL